MGGGRPGRKSQNVKVWSLEAQAVKKFMGSQVASYGRFKC
jgi:hypothetical protein